MTNLKHCDRFRTNLISNLTKRLGFVEKKDLYVHSTILTPRYGMNWMNSSEKEDFNKRGLVRAVETYIAKHPIKIKKNNANESSQLIEQQEIEPPKAKRLKILSYVEQTNVVSNNLSDDKSIKKQFDNYLEFIKLHPNETRDTGKFWLNHEKIWPELAAYTKSLLTVPASSAAVERVFSVGGSILRPSRRRLSDHLFEMLMFLKCNLHLFKNNLKI